MKSKDFKNWLSLELYLARDDLPRLAVLQEVYEKFYQQQPNLNKINIDYELVALARLPQPAPLDPQALAPWE